MILGLCLKMTPPPPPALQKEMNHLPIIFSAFAVSLGECIFNHLSNEKNLGWLGYIGDDILPSYKGIIS